MTAYIMKQAGEKILARTIQPRASERHRSQGHPMTLSVAAVVPPAENGSHRRSLCLAEAIHMSAGPFRPV